MKCGQFVHITDHVTILITGSPKVEVILVVTDPVTLPLADSLPVVGLPQLFSSSSSGSSLMQDDMEVT